MKRFPHIDLERVMGAHDVSMFILERTEPGPHPTIKVYPLNAGASPGVDYAAQQGMVIEAYVPDPAIAAYLRQQWSPVLVEGHERRSYPLTYPNNHGEMRDFTATMYQVEFRPDYALAVTLVIDETERKRAEEARVALQEEIIDLQAAAIAELSTPLIPITKEILVMPLVGSMDSRRALTILQTVLDGVERHRARAVILDITGVPVVDTQVANVLIRAAQAGRLLGAQVIITGIKPEVAQTIIGLGIQLDMLQTFSTLQEAISAVLLRSNGAFAQLGEY